MGHVVNVGWCKITHFVLLFSHLVLYSFWWLLLLFGNRKKKSGLSHEVSLVFEIRGNRFPPPRTRQQLKWPVFRHTRKRRTVEVYGARIRERNDERYTSYLFFLFYFWLEIKTNKEITSIRRYISQVINILASKSSQNEPLAKLSAINQLSLEPVATWTARPIGGLKQRNQTQK